MLDWDNVRFFLCVARASSIRAAAGVLGVNHATVSRRVGALEQRLGVRLFEKLPSGYQITSAGEEILAIAERMEDDALSLERRVFGRDAALTGPLRVTLPQVLATHLLMPDLARFADSYPGIALELVTSYEALNLTKREADVAIRLSAGSPPEHLYGRKLASVHRAVYSASDGSGRDANRWVVKEEDGPVPAWAAKSAGRSSEQALVVGDPLVQSAASRAGLGVSLNFCFIGDQDPILKRLPPGETRPYGDLWVLTHGDLRRTPRVQTFMRFIAEAVRSKRALLDGSGVSPSL